MNHEIPSTPSSESPLVPARREGLPALGCEAPGGRRSTGPAAGFSSLHRRSVARGRYTRHRVAQEVGRLLGWPVYDHGLLEKIAQDMGLRTSLLESVDERQQSWLLEMAEAFLSTPRKSDWGPLVSGERLRPSPGQDRAGTGVHGECVIVGRGAVFILPAATTLRVRLVGPVRERIAVLSRNLGISEREAARQVRTMDRERTDFVQDLFSTEPERSPELRSGPQCVSSVRCPNAELIVETLHRLQARA